MLGKATIGSLNVFEQKSRNIWWCWRQFTPCSAQLMQDSNQVSLPTLFNNISKFHTYLHIFLTSEFVDFRFPNKGSKFIPSTVVPLLGTMSDAEIQLISGGSFGEVYSARRNEPGKIVAKRWFVKRIIGGCMNCEIHEITTGCCLGGRSIYFLIWKYVCICILDMWGYLCT